MTRWFTLGRWRSPSIGWLLQMVFLAYGSLWQTLTSPPDQVGISVANLVGALWVIVALHVDGDRRSERIEQWAYPPLVFSLSAYLWLALRFGGWHELVMQPNLGVLFTMSAACTAAARFVWLLTGPRVQEIGRQRQERRHRRRVRRKAMEIVADALPYDDA